MPEPVQIKYAFHKDIGLIERLSLPVAAVSSLDDAIEKLRTFCLGRGASLYLSEVPLPTDDGMLHINMGYHSEWHYDRYHQLVRTDILEILGFSEADISWVDGNELNTEGK